MADAELQAAIAARDKQVAALLSNPSGAVKAALADPPYTAADGETRVRANRTGLLGRLPPFAPRWHLALPHARRAARARRSHPGGAYGGTHMPCAKVCAFALQGVTADDRK